MSSARACVGCLLGTAAGDALGLPYEGLSPRRGARLFPDRDRHHLLFGKGMVSDDTEHAAFVAQALLRGRGDPNAFARHLARSLRWWLLGLPAGVGFATLRAIIKLWLGWPPERAGVFSAGNGPAMRSPLLGVAFGHDPAELRRWVTASTRLTHRDPKALWGALAVALAAHVSAGEGPVAAEPFLRALRELLAAEPAGELLELIEQAAQSAARAEPVTAFAQSIGSRNGISGYIYHTVPCVLQVWFCYGADFRGGLQEILRAGGDTDTTGAIFGAIVGAGVGKPGIPTAWLADIIEWPRSVAWLEALGQEVARGLTDWGQAPPPPPYVRPGVIPRNLLFLLVVLTHGLRRLAPPY